MLGSILGFLGALLGFIGVIISAKITRNKELTESEIKSVIEGSNRNVYKEVENLNRELKKELTEENLKFQSKWEQKKIDADIISKSRMDWINNTKIITSNFMNDSLSVSANYVMFIEKIQQINKLENISSHALRDSRDKSLTKESRLLAENALSEFERQLQYLNSEMIGRTDLINELVSKIAQNYMLIRLNFSKNKENDQVVELAFEVYEEIRKFSLKFSWAQFDQPPVLEQYSKETKDIRNKNSLKIEELANVLREYYKKEWEKVKQGK